jgi:hypothetical protein
MFGKGLILPEFLLDPGWEVEPARLVSPSFLRSVPCYAGTMGAASIDWNTVIRRANPA